MPKNPMFNVRVAVRCETCDNETCKEVITTQMVSRRDMIIKLQEQRWQRFNNGWMCRDCCERLVKE